jgi:hypothetical protein
MVWSPSRFQNRLLRCRYMQSRRNFKLFPTFSDLFIFTFLNDIHLCQYGPSQAATIGFLVIKVLKLIQSIHVIPLLPYINS